MTPLRRTPSADLSFGRALWLRARRYGAIAGVAAFLAGLGGEGWQWHVTHGLPEERAIVKAVVPASGSSHCGRDDWRPNRTIVWRSTDPPSGLPSTFLQVTGCNLPSVGSRHTIVRRPHADGTNTVYDDPPRSLADVFGLGVAIGVLGLLVGAVAAVLREGFGRLVRRRR